MIIIPKMADLEATGLMENCYYRIKFNFDKFIDRVEI